MSLSLGWDQTVDILTLIIAVLGVLVSAGLFVRVRRDKDRLDYSDQHLQSEIGKREALQKRLLAVDPERFIDRMDLLERGGNFEGAELAAQSFVDLQGEAFGRAAAFLAEQRLLDADTMGRAAAQDALRFARIGLAADPSSKRLKGFLKEAQAQDAALARGEPPVAAKLDGLDWSALQTMASEFIRDGHYILGEVAARRAALLARAQHPGNTREAALTYWQHGVALRHLARDEKALEMLERAYAITKAIDEPTSDWFDAVENSLSVLYSTIGRFSEAEDLHRAAIDRLENAGAGDSANAALHLRNLSVVLMHLGRIEEAGVVTRQALDLTLKAEGKGTKPHAAALNNYAQFLMSAGHAKEAETFHREALELQKTLRGENHPETALSQKNLGNLLVTEGRAEDARPLLSAALETYRAAFRSAHPDIVGCMNDLAWAEARLGHWDRAHELFAEAADMCSILRGAEDAHTVELRQNAEMTLAELVKTTGE